MECEDEMYGNAAAATFYFFITCLHVGLYIPVTLMTSFMTLRVHARADMCTREGRHGFT